MRMIEDGLKIKKYEIDKVKFDSGVKFSDFRIYFDV
jgi:hypothetical protein